MAPLTLQTRTETSPRGPLTHACQDRFGSVEDISVEGVDDHGNPCEQRCGSCVEDAAGRCWLQASLLRAGSRLDEKGWVKWLD